MPQLTQGLIVASLIGLLLAVIVGYYLRQGQVNDLTQALHESQKRQEDLEREHEQRLRDATQQLQKDYEAQLAESIERHQAQLDEQRSQLESEYRARQGLVGSAPPAADDSVEPRIRKQYETRLKEVAAKMQQAYEQHLQERLAEERAIAQQDYDRRLAEAMARPSDPGFSLVEGSGSPGAMGGAIGGSMGTEQSVASIAAAASLAELEAQLQAEYDQRLTDRIAQYQDEMAQRLAQLEQDYEARLQMAGAPGLAAAESQQPSIAELELNLRHELEESLRVEYEQKLAEKIEHYQNELTQRTQELEQSYEARLQLLQIGSSAASSAPSGADLDLANAIAAANADDLATSDETGFGTGLEPGLDNGFNLDDFSPGTEAGADTPDDLGLADLLDSDLESSQDAGLSLGSDFDTTNFETTNFDTEDLESLLSAPGPESASDDLLDSLDDISDLS